MTDMTVRAKFTCNTKINTGSNTTVFLHAVYNNTDGSRAEENKVFTDATPAGYIQVVIANDKPALLQFEPGETYYVDFIPVK